MIDKKILLGYGAFVIVGIAAGMWLGNRSKKGKKAAAAATDSKLALSADAEVEGVNVGKPMTIEQAMNHAASGQPQQRRQQRGGQQGGQGQRRQGNNGGAPSLVKNSRYTYDIKSQDEFDDWKGR